MQNVFSIPQINKTKMTITIKHFTYSTIKKNNMKTTVKNFPENVIGMIFCIAMIPTAEIRKVVVVARLPRSVDKLIVHVYAIHAAMTDNAWFQDASYLLADVKSKNDNLQKAQNSAKTKTIGSAKFRDTEKNVLLNGVFELVSYVRKICNQFPDSAVSIAESALFHAKGRGGMPKQSFTAKSIAPGSVLLRGTVGYPSYMHNWIMSKNPSNPASWNNIIIPSTLIAKTIVTDLTSGERVYFRHRFLGKVGYSDWEQMISIIVS